MQFRHLFVRTFRSYWRNPAYNVNRMLFQLGVALLLGLTFIRLGHSQIDLACAWRGVCAAAFELVCRPCCRNLLLRVSRVAPPACADNAQRVGHGHDYRLAGARLRGAQSLLPRARQVRLLVFIPAPSAGSGVYQYRAFLASTGLVEIPFIMFNSLLFSAVFYWFDVARSRKRYGCATGSPTCARTVLVTFSP